MSNVDEASPSAVQSELHSPSKRLNEAIDYVLQKQGKRLRARLCEASCRLFNGHDVAAQQAAEAIEWLHTYSLIHDDLPAMDDDELRRGQPSLHVQYDDATAILVGDGLQAAAFERLVNLPDLSAERRLRIVAVISNAVGFRGMVGGQALDMEAEQQAVSLGALETIHRHKTGALIRAAVVTGALCSSAAEDDLRRLTCFADDIGLAFQVTDDVLDSTRSSDDLGKTAGKDEASSKSTYVSCMGIGGAQTIATQLFNDAVGALEPYGERADELRELAHIIVQRQH